MIVYYDRFCWKLFINEKERNKDRKKDRSRERVKAYKKNQKLKHAKHFMHKKIKARL